MFLWQGDSFTGPYNSNVALTNLATFCLFSSLLMFKILSFWKNGDTLPPESACKVMRSGSDKYSADEWFHQESYILLRQLNAFH
jgi:hypothetical protein